MNQKELNEMLSAVDRGDSMAFRDISKRMSELAAREQTKEAVELAVLSYALNKIYSKAHFGGKIKDLRGELVSALRSGNMDAALHAVRRFDEKHGFFNGNIIEKARIKVGSRIYSNGISLSAASNLSGAHTSDLQDYVGNTKTEYPSKNISIRDRIQVARKIFGGKQE